jgi:hypothetical protein
MDITLQSLFGLLCTAVLIGRLPPSPAFGLIYEGAIGQPRKTTSPCILSKQRFFALPYKILQFLSQIYTGCILD